MSDERQPIEILLAHMRQKLARGGLTYAPAVTLEDIITTINKSIRQTAEALEPGFSDSSRDADRRLDSGRP